MNSYQKLKEENKRLKETIRNLDYYRINLPTVIINRVIETLRKYPRNDNFSVEGRLVSANYIIEEDIKLIVKNKDELFPYKEVPSR